jgi:large subunit ribosomal protein L22
MGKRKKLRAESLKEQRKTLYFAILRNSPIAPRKMRLVADMIRGVEVNKALDYLRYNKKHAARPVEKLLLSAIANWQKKNENIRIEDTELFVSSIKVDEGKVLKRIQPAPQGRAHRINKRSNHVTLFVDQIVYDEELETVFDELDNTTEESTN